MAERKPRATKEEALNAKIAANLAAQAKLVEKLDALKAAEADLKQQLDELKNAAVERRIVSGTDDGLFSGDPVSLATHSGRGDMNCAV